MKKHKNGARQVSEGTNQLKIPSCVGIPVAILCVPLSQGAF